jgi:hypothetical protein
VVVLTRESSEQPIVKDATLGLMLALKVWKAWVSTLVLVSKNAGMPWGSRFPEVVACVSVERESWTASCGIREVCC